MKVLILAGGLGSRLSEETELKPKPMVQIGGKPILWHIMKTYSLYGFNEFVILCGYKGYVIKEYFINYFSHMSNLTVNLKDNSLEYHSCTAEPWKVTLLDTGLHTMTGGRIKKAEDYIGNERFMLTYGDGVADVDLDSLLATHKEHGKLITMTSVQPEGRFGALEIESDGMIKVFKEKPRGDGAWINGGYFICEPQVLDYITEGEQTIFERSPLEKLASDRELYTYKHRGFWKPMDTLRDKNQLEEMIQDQTAPWIKW